MNDLMVHLPILIENPVQKHVNSGISVELGVCLSVFRIAERFAVDNFSV